MFFEIIYVYSCMYCDEIETSEHYYFRCNRFVDQLDDLFTDTNTVHSINAHILLYGNSQLKHHVYR